MAFGREGKGVPQLGHGINRFSPFKLSESRVASVLESVPISTSKIKGCDAFSSAADSSAAVCLCYLLREPPILGFPLNSTRLLSLPSVCLPANRASTVAQSLNSLCSGSRNKASPLQ
ncbi:non-specific lipid transfer protein-like 1 [Senna tora]|uniref:Non-specific lipid transfer protein-like 1 n=1 Tax=Senna tora TaxID=362788 RepID=A0A834W2G9_9FABA|nr:non-specific lipid transfer protein-like 1 [Senna tora]